MSKNKLKNYLQDQYNQISKSIDDIPCSDQNFGNQYTLNLRIETIKELAQENNIILEVI